MQHHTTGDNSSQVHAEALLADMTAAAGTAIPKREALTDWLKAYLLRARARGYVVDRDDTDNLNALDKFLREQNVPVARLTVA
jgi:hypothetical protein